MARILAGLFTTLILLQTFSRELVVVDYELHKERVTELFCVNKDKPRLQCNGKCHLAQKLRKASSAESQTPAGSFAKTKYDAVLPPPAPLAAPIVLRPAAAGFGRLVPAPYSFSPAHSIFHPPSWLA